MNRTSTSDLESSIVEEHVLWSVFVRTHLITGVISAATLMYSFFSLFVWRQGIHTIQLVLFLVGFSGLVYFCVSLFTLVTYFRYDGERLTVRRFGRRQRQITPLDITLVRSDQLGSVSALWLRDGSTFQFCFKSLPKAQSVIESLKRQIRNESLLEGHINVLALAKMYAPSVVPAAVGVLVPTTFAVMSLLAQRQALWNAGPLAWILAALMFVPLLLVYLAVQNCWGPVVSYYSWDGSTIRFRRLGSRRIWEHSINDIESILSTHVNTPTTESGNAFWIAMKDKKRYKLLTALIPNGREVVDELKQHLNRAATTPVYAFRAVTLEQSDDVQRIQSMLFKDEQLLWLGRPRRGAVFSRVAAEVLFGMIPIAMGGALAALCTFELMRGGGGVWVGALVGYGFVGVGLYAWTAPWRYRYLLSTTLYAVTNRRAIILDGVDWDNRGSLQRSKQSVEVFQGEALRLFEVLPQEKGIALGGFSTQGRKGIRWQYQGFFAPQNQSEAVQALKWSIWQMSGNG